MAEQDTVRLLRECDAGVRMGTASIDEVLDYVSSPKLKKRLADCKSQHEVLKGQLQQLLDDHHDEGKAPNPAAKGMSWMKTNMKLAWDGSDNTIADLMTDGCNMGVKSLHRYLNQYKAADAKSKKITKELINLEEGLVMDIREFL